MRVRKHRYLAQYARALRYLAELETPSEEHARKHDQLITFAMHCWHLKDHIAHDTSLAGEVRQRVLDSAHSSIVLQAWRDLANGAKHLVKKPTRPSRNEFSRMTLGVADYRPAVAVPLVTTADGSDRDGIEFAREAMAEWNRILTAEGVSTDLAGAPEWWR